jgi:hypothetical protein
MGAIAPAVASSPVPPLSVFKREARRTAWIALDGGSAQRVIATFPGVGQPEVGWRKDRKEAIVVLTPDVGAVAAYRVALPGGACAPFALPRTGRVKQVGFDEVGRPVALTSESELGETGIRKPVKAGKAYYFAYAGKKFPIDPGAEGEPELEHAFRFENGAWKEFETKVSSTGWDYAMGTSALDAYDALAPRSPRQREQLAPELKDVEDKALAKRLNGVAGAFVDAEYSLWGRVATPSGPLYVLQEQGEFVHPTNVLVWGDGPRLTRVAGLDVPNAKDYDFAHDRHGLRFVDLARRGDYLLVTTTGADGHPRLYDLATRRLVFSSDAFVDASFWPQ